MLNVWPCALVVLWLLPIATAVWSSQHARHVRWRNIGVVLGLVASPACMGLYSLLFLSRFTAPLGMLGLPLSMLHMAPGYWLGDVLGLIPRYTVLTGGMQLVMAALCAMVWAPVYGWIGARIDARASPG